MYDECLRWLSRYAATPGLAPDVVTLIKKKHAFHHRLAGLSYIRISKEYGKGQNALLRAINERPTYLIDWRVLAGLLICVGHKGLRIVRGS